MHTARGAVVGVLVTALTVGAAAAALPAAAATASPPATVATPTAAAAGTAYVWSGGGDGETWTDALNWAPVGVPGTGDSVSVQAPSDDVCHAHVDGVPDDLRLADLTIDERLFRGDPASACRTSLDGGSITVTHQFTFHAGLLDTPVTIAAGATGAITPGAAYDTTHIGTGGVVVDGTLTLTGNAEAGAGGSDQHLSLTGGPGITVDAGATLVAAGTNDLSADCCNNPAHLLNRGTVQLSGTTTLDAVELDQDGTVDASGGAVLLTDFAPQTAGPGARWTGSGSWRLGFSSVTTVSGTQTLAKGFSWQLGGNGSGAQEYLYGTFTLAGTGRFLWNGGVIGAAMTVGSGIRFAATGQDAAADPRRLSGQDTAGHPVTVTNRGTMTFSGGAGWYGTSGAQLVTTATGVLTLGRGTMIGADCCNTPAAIVNNGGRVVVPGGAGTVVIDDTGYRATGGTLQVGSGSDLELTGGATGSLSTTTITGGGTVGLAQPVTTSGTETVASSTTLTLEKGGAVTTSGTVTTTIGGDGSFAWTGGSITGALTVSTAAGQTVSGAATRKSVLVPTGSSGSTVTFAGPTTVAAGTARAADTVDLDPAAALVFTGVVTLQVNTLLSGGTVTTTDAATLRIEVNGPAAARLDLDGRASLAGTLVLVDRPGYQPATGAVVTLALAHPVAVGFSCTTTTGDGAATQHWVTRATSARLQVVSQPGAATGC